MLLISSFTILTLWAVQGIGPRPRVLCSFYWYSRLRALLLPVLPPGTSPAPLDVCVMKLLPLEVRLSEVLGQLAVQGVAATNTYTQVRGELRKEIST
jgi:hypothetical protein